MGCKYTVQVWGQHWKDQIGCLNNQDYSYRAVWQGESLLMALWELAKAKRLGFGCTTLEWR